jgi:RNA polymerase sigma-70 factor (family 1)
MKVQTGHLSDKELLDQMRSGSQSAMTEIYKRYWDKLFVVAHNRLQDEQEAEETVQDVFCSLWNRRSSLDIQYELITYLSVATKYQVINRQAKAWKKAQHIEFSEAFEESADSTNLWFAEKELKEQLAAAINTLPSKCRIIFKLRHEEHLSNAEIAGQLNVSEKNIEAHITRAAKHLRGSLQISATILFYLLKK